MKVLCGDKELYDSSTFLVFGDQEATVTFGEGEEQLGLILSFLSSDGDEQSQDLGLVDEKTLKISFTNWDNPFGTTLTEPLKVGNIFGRQVYLIYVINKIGEKSPVRQVTLNVYLGEEVQDGTD